MPEPSPSPRHLVFVLPVFDDWESFELLLGRIDAACAACGTTGAVVAVDDGSNEPRPAPRESARHSLTTVDVLALRRNVGHQRAIALGLAFVHAERPCDAVVVMDTDGEDLPEDVPALVHRYASERGRAVVFAKRRKRLERAWFRAGYRVFQALHRLLTGIAVEVGNFSIVPAARLPALVAMPELWNHYAAAVFRSRVPFASVPLDRGVRLAGRSKMGFVALVVHGLSAISVFSEIVAVRALIATSAAVAVTVAALAAVAVAAWARGAPLPPWLGFGTALFAVLALQLLGIAAGFVLHILKARSDLGFLPVRDFRYFVAGVTRLEGAPEPRKEAATRTT